MDMIGIDHAYIVKHFQLNNFLNIGFAYAYNWVNSIWLCRYDAWSPTALQLERTHFFSPTNSLGICAKELWLRMHSPVWCDDDEYLYPCNICLKKLWYVILYDCQSAKAWKSLRPPLPKAKYSQRIGSDMRDYFLVYIFMIYTFSTMLARNRI